MTRLLKRVFLLLVVIVSGNMLLAQGHPPSSPSPLSQTNSSPGGAPINPGVDDPKARDSAFAKKSLENGYAVVKMSELAQQNSQRDDVKQFAQKAADDQKEANGRLEQFAKQLGVALPTELSHRDQRTLTKLQGLSGPKFDEEYLKAMQKDQQDDLKSYKQETGDTQDPTLQSMLKQDGATISQRLDAMKTLTQSGK